MNDDTSSQDLFNFLHPQTHRPRFPKRDKNELSSSTFRITSTFTMVKETLTSQNHASSFTIEEMIERSNADITFHITVTDPWYTMIEKGEKTIEGRLHKGRYAELKVGDKISIFPEMTPFCIVKTIVNLHIYDSFSSLLERHLAQTLPGVRDVASGVEVYRQFYKQDEERRYGVVGIEIE